MKRYLIKLFLVLLCLFLSSCAILRQPPAAGNQVLNRSERAAQLQRIQAWTITGSTSIQHQDKTDIASLKWVQQSGDYDIALSGPLSIGHVTLKGNPQTVTLTQSNQAAVSAPSPELLMQKQLGWQIPVSALYYWVRGLPAPAADYTAKMDRYQHIIQLNQQGWNITYLAFMQVNGIDLPRTMTLVNPQLHIRLAIKNWVLPQ